MSDKKPSNSRLTKRAKLALKAKGKQYKRYRKGPVLVIIPTTRTTTKLTTIQSTINKYSIEG